MAYPDGHNIVQLVNVLRVFLTYRHMGGNQFTEIIQCQPRPYFLDDGVRFFTMESRQSDRVFEFSERGFLTLALIIKGFEQAGREPVAGEIGNKVFVRAVRQLDTDNPQGHTVRAIRPVFEEVERCPFPYKTGQRVRIHGRNPPANQCDIHCDIKLSRQGAGELLCFHLLGTDEEESAFFYDMCINVERGNALSVIKRVFDALARGRRSTMSQKARKSSLPWQGWMTASM